MDVNQWRLDASGLIDATDIGFLVSTIERGHEVLRAPDSAPLAVVLDAALTLAALHVAAHEAGDRAWDHLGWARVIAAYVADRSADVPSGAVIHLASRAGALLRLDRTLTGTAQTERETRCAEGGHTASLWYAATLDEVVARTSALIAVAESLQDPALGTPDARAALRDEGMELLVLARRAGEPALAWHVLDVLGRVG